MQIKINQDKEIVNQIREKIKQNQGHCCCAIELTDDNICMCKVFREQIEAQQPGFCECGLYEIILNK